MQTLSTSPDSRSARLVVCEKTGRWAAQLRRILNADARWVVETRSLVQLLEALAEHPASLGVVEVTEPNFDQVHAALLRIAVEFPLARVVITADEISADVAWVLREAGAIHAASALRRLDGVAELWRRHCEQFPPRAASELDRVLASLPWAE